MAGGGGGGVDDCGIGVAVDLAHAVDVEAALDRVRVGDAEVVGPDVAVLEGLGEVDGVAEEGGEGGEFVAVVVLLDAGGLAEDVTERNVGCAGGELDDLEGV